ncbi:MAG: hypothetical protein ABFD08_15255 [Syntrophomonas sp.]
MISFNIDFPKNLTEPKGLHLPRCEDVEQAVTLVKLALDYFPDIEAVADEEDWEFIVKVGDEVSFHDRKLCDCSDLGEGICFHPSITRWNPTSIFEMILHTLIGPKPENTADLKGE